MSVVGSFHLLVVSRHPLYTGEGVDDDSYIVLCFELAKKNINKISRLNHFVGGH